jgi:hypothetical protein
MSNGDDETVTWHLASVCESVDKATAIEAHRTPPVYTPAPDYR